MFILLNCTFTSTKILTKSMSAKKKYKYMTGTKIIIDLPLMTLPLMTSDSSALLPVDSRLLNRRGIFFLGL